VIAAGFYIALNLEDWKVALEHKHRMLVTKEFKTKGMVKFLLTLLFHCYISSHLRVSSNSDY